MEQTIFRNCFKTILYLYQLKKVSYFSGTTRIDSWKCNGISKKKNVENITKSDSNFASTFVDNHLSPDIILMDTV